MYFQPISSIQCDRCLISGQAVCEIAQRCSTSVKVRHSACLGRTGPSVLKKRMGRLWHLPRVRCARGTAPPWWVVHGPAPWPRSGASRAASARGPRAARSSLKSPCAGGEDGGGDALLHRPGLAAPMRWSEEVAVFAGGGVGPLAGRPRGAQPHVERAPLRAVEVVGLPQRTGRSGAEGPSRRRCGRDPPRGRRTRRPRAGPSRSQICPKMFM